MGNYERAEQIAAKEFKLKKTIEENELAIVINELSEYLEECTNELHKDT
jgi:translation initiation factor IF-3